MHRRKYARKNARRRIRRRVITDLSRGIEIIDLRAQTMGERDYARELKDETWCWLREELSKKHGLRFLVRSITREAVVVGGIDVFNTLVMDSGQDFIKPDQGVDEEAVEELDYSWAMDKENGQKCYILKRVAKSGPYNCRTQVKLTVGNCFEFQFKHWWQNWGGNVKLTAIKSEPAWGEAHLRAQFEVRFFRLEDD